MPRGEPPAESNGKNREADRHENHRKGIFEIRDHTNVSGEAWRMVPRSSATVSSEEQLQSLAISWDSHFRERKGRGGQLVAMGAK